MKRISKRLKILGAIVVLIILGGLFCVWQNNSIVISRSDYYSPRLPKAFDNFKIVQISDLHNKMFGENQKNLLKKVESLEPAIILITGDLVDRRKFDLETAMYFARGAVQIAPTYYVSGNHEAWSGEYTEIKEQLLEVGVLVIDDTAIEISKGDSAIQVLGLSDPDFLTSNYLEGTNTSRLAEQLGQLAQSDQFKILLSHRPELFDLYCANDIDLVFTGHAHGGQIRIPFVGGLIAPDQGLFPKYTSGSYNNQSTTMYVSRGLGNSVFPVRVFNRPEIVAVTLKSEK